MIKESKQLLNSDQLISKSPLSSKYSDSIIIAMDGPSASGKGCISKGLAKAIGFDYLDTGSLYRAVASLMLKNNLKLDNIDAIIKLIEQIDFSNLDIADLNSTAVSNFVPSVASLSEVRKALYNVQKNFPQGKKGAVIEGRDIGTVIFPDAHAKFLITAALEVRAKRRFKQLQNAGENIIYEQVLKDLKERDFKDSTRKAAPFAADNTYIVLDTGLLTLEDSIKKLLELLKPIL